MAAARSRKVSRASGASASAARVITQRPKIMPPTSVTAEEMCSHRMNT
jgi:hypothetical protein